MTMWAKPHLASLQPHRHMVFTYTHQLGGPLSLFFPLSGFGQLTTVKFMSVLGSDSYSEQWQSH
jgi:hypothetical protein